MFLGKTYLYSSQEGDNIKQWLGATDTFRLKSAQILSTPLTPKVVCDWSKHLKKRWIFHLLILFYQDWILNMKSVFWYLI